MAKSATPTFKNPNKNPVRTSVTAGSLTEAIGLAHDLGHPPFGHIGEDVLDRCLQERYGTGFRHYEHSLRVVDVLERDGAGLNLNAPVRDGILGHSGRAEPPATLEGRIVRLVDRIAYINHDIDDAVRAGVIGEGDLPADAIAALGPTGSQRIDTLVHDLVEHSEAAGDIVQGAAVGAAMDDLRTFMFDRVYLGPEARREHARVEAVLRGLFEHYVARPEELPPSPARPCFGTRPSRRSRSRSRAPTPFTSRWPSGHRSPRPSRRCSTPCRARPSGRPGTVRPRFPWARTRPCSRMAMPPTACPRASSS